MASNAKFCSQCASPLPEPNPPFCSQCGTAVKPNDVQPSQPMRPSRSNNKPLPDWINSGSKNTSIHDIIKDIIVKHPFRAILVAVVILPVVLAILTVVILAIPSETDISNTIDDAPEPKGGIISVSSIDGSKYDASLLLYDIGYSKNSDGEVTGVGMFKSISERRVGSESMCIPGNIRIHLDGEVYFMTTGTSVEILEQADCDLPPSGMVKVRVPENGREGWTYARNVVPVFKR